jgi:hypothetical protein
LSPTVLYTDAVIQTKHVKTRQSESKPHTQYSTMASPDVVVFTLGVMSSNLDGGDPDRRGKKRRPRRSERGSEEAKKRKEMGWRTPPDEIDQRK